MVTQFHRFLEAGTLFLRPNALAYPPRDVENSFISPPVTFLRNNRSIDRITFYRVLLVCQDVINKYATFILKSIKSFPRKAVKGFFHVPIIQVFSSITCVLGNWGEGGEKRKEKKYIYILPSLSCGEKLQSALLITTVLCIMDNCYSCVKFHTPDFGV